MAVVYTVKLALCLAISIAYSEGCTRSQCYNVVCPTGCANPERHLRELGIESIGERSSKHSFGAQLKVRCIEGYASESGRSSGAGKCMGDGKWKILRLRCHPHTPKRKTISPTQSDTTTITTMQTSTSPLRAIDRSSPAPSPWSYPRSSSRSTKYVQRFLTIPTRIPRNPLKNGESKFVMNNNLICLCATLMVVLLRRVL